MKNHNLAFTDLETTGLDAHEHEIIEIGCIIARQAPALIGGPKIEVMEEFLLKVKPEHLETADPEALKINGYNEAEWKDAIPLKEAMEIFANKTVDAALIAQNVSFDWVFLDEAFRKTGVENKMHYHKLDVISFAFAKLYDKPDAQKFSLRALCKYLGVRNEKEHSALADIRATFEVYKKLIEM
ncbi:MAG: 3'-5' exonuclease [Parcubacteria group bacterium]|nr:3'-5' exonuclease [Parcubacteria group bacterium]MCR4342647.1 3'-5' exonuclease [Patescibacteria group bacterium]